MVTLAGSLKAYRDFRVHDNQYLNSINGDRHDYNKRFSKIYGEKFLLGSYLTAPLRNYENAFFRLSLLERHITAVETGGMSYDLVLGSVFLVVDVIARAILSFGALIGDGINSGITLCCRKRLLAERGSENRNYGVSRSLEYLADELSSELSRGGYQHIWIYGEGGGISSSGYDVKMEYSKFIDWKGVKESLRDKFKSEFFDEFSLTLEPGSSLEVRQVSGDLVLPYSIDGEFLREGHAKAATDALVNHLTEYFSSNTERTLRDIEVFVNGNEAFVKVFYINSTSNEGPVSREADTEIQPGKSSRMYFAEQMQKVGDVCQSLATKISFIVKEVFTQIKLSAGAFVGIFRKCFTFSTSPVLPNQEGVSDLTLGARVPNVISQELQSRPQSSSYIDRFQRAIAGVSPGSKLKEYTGIIKTEIVNYNKLYQVMHRISDKESSFFSISSKFFNLGVESIFDSYSEGYCVSIVFSLDEDCSSEVEAIRTKEHTIELLNENDEVVETYTREITQERIDFIKEQKLQLTVEYIADFIEAMSSRYSWDPTAASICGVSQGKGLDSQGRIMLKIHLPNRLGGKLLVGNPFLERRAPGDLSLEESV